MKEREPEHKSIQLVVTAYESTFANQFALFRTQLASVTSNLDTQFAEAKESAAELREVYRIPEVLAGMLLNTLSTEAALYLQSPAGIRWFWKAFPQYRVAQKL